MDTPSLVACKYSSPFGLLSTGTENVVFKNINGQNVITMIMIVVCRAQTKI